MPPAESENDALTDQRTAIKTDERTHERIFFLNGGYNIIPRTF